MKDVEKQNMNNNLRFCFAFLCFCDDAPCLPAICSSLFTLTIPSLKVFLNKKKSLKISACLAVSRTRDWLRACCWNNDLARSCSWRNKRTLPRILTFAGGFATSVSSNSPQISSLHAVIDGNIWPRTAKTVIWNFRWKLFIRTEGLCIPLSKNTWNKPKMI